MEKDQDLENRDERRRLPYEAPKIVETAEFETLAMACTKTSLATCGGGRQFS